MSRITIAIEAQTPSNMLALELHRATGLGIAEVKQRLSAGLPVFDQDIFGGPQEEISAKVLNLLGTLERYGHLPVVHESGQPISAQVLRNIVQSAEREVQKIQERGDPDHVRSTS